MNMLARIQNAVANGLNSKTCKTGHVPNYMVVVLDDDLISYLDHKGVATLFGNWVEWLVHEIDSLLQKRYAQLPGKCKTKAFLYWVTAPTHHYFSKERNNKCIKFILSLEAVVRQQECMRVIKLKQFWDTKDSLLVINDRVTEVGMVAYWNAVDASFRYNVTRHEQAVAKAAANFIGDHPISQPSDSSHSVAVPQSQSHPRPDPMFSFFDRHRARNILS